MTTSLINWKRVRSRLSTDEWYLLGSNIPYTHVARVQSGLMLGMEDVVIATRNNHYVAGRRHCDAYAKLKGAGDPCYLPFP